MTPRIIARQAPLSVEFSRPEYQNGLPFPSPGHLPNPGIEPRSPVLQIDSLLPELLGKPRALLYSYFLDLLQFYFVLFWLLTFSCSLVPASVWFLVLAVPFPSCLPRASLHLVSIRQQQSLELLANLYSLRGSLGNPHVVLFWLWTSHGACDLTGLLHFTISGSFFPPQAIQVEGQCWVVSLGVPLWPSPCGVGGHTVLPRPPNSYSNKDLARPHLIVPVLGMSIQKTHLTRMSG